VLSSLKRRRLIVLKGYLAHKNIKLRFLMLLSKRLASLK